MSANSNNYEYVIPMNPTTGELSLPGFQRAIQPQAQVQPRPVAAPIMNPTAQGLVSSMTPSPAQQAPQLAAPERLPAVFAEPQPVVQAYQTNAQAQSIPLPTQPMQIHPAPVQAAPAQPAAPQLQLRTLNAFVYYPAAITFLDVVAIDNGLLIRMPANTQLPDAIKQYGCRVEGVEKRLCVNADYVDPSTQLRNVVLMVVDE